MSISIFVVSLLLLQLICLIVGKQASRKMESQEDYFLAGRGIRFFPLLMTLIATQVGGGLVLGSAEEAFRYGWYVLFYPAGACLGLLLLAAGIGSRLSKINVSTVAQIFEVVYRSDKLKKIASSLSILSLFMILIAQVMASKRFMISLGVGDEWLFMSFWAIVIIYTMIGGLKAVVATDIVQALFFIVIFVTCFISTLLGQTSFDIAANPVAFDFDQSKWMGWLLMPLLFMLIEQDMAQRCFGAKSAKVVSWASAIAALSIMTICAIPVYYGILGKSLGVEVVPGSSVLMTVLQLTTNPTLTALFGCAILAAIISTADSLMNAISSNVSQDFEFKFLEREKSKVRFSQWVTGTIGCLAVFCSYYFANVVDILIQSYALSVSCLLIPVVAALWSRSYSTLAAAYGMAAGAAGFILTKILPEFWLPKEIIPLMLSAMGFAVGEALFRLRLVRRIDPSI